MLKWNRKNVLVTGGCGLIGSFVVRKLIKRKVNRVVILDNMKAYQLDVFCCDLKDVDNVSIINGDICDEKLVYKIMGDIDGSLLNLVLMFIVFDCFYCKFHCKTIPYVFNPCINLI